MRALEFIEIYTIFFSRKPFIHHNLLFYTSILQEFLNRAEKLNLRSGKDTQLFYRVTKVRDLSDASSNKRVLSRISSCNAFAFCAKIWS